MRIPYIPKRTYDHQPMCYWYCESPDSAMEVSREMFLRLLKEQPCPMAQVNIDLDGGYCYLIPYDSELAEDFIRLNRETERDYKRHWRELQEIRAGKRQAELRLDQVMTDDGQTLSDLIVAPEAHDGRGFATLPEDDRELLLAYLQENCNARRLAQRLGKDPSGILKRIKRAAARLQKNLEENF